MASVRVLQLCALLTVLLALVGAQLNFCKVPALCGDKVHIACNNTYAWGDDCPETPEPAMVANTPELNQLIVQLHNVRRNQLALGNLNGYGPARRMATIRWSPELTQMARLNVRRCLAQRDACHNTNSFRNSGQNIAQRSAAAGQTNEQLITNAIASWWNQFNNANQQYMISYPAAYTGPPIAKFALMAQQANTHVGCAMARFVKDSDKKFLMTCNYAVDNVAGDHVYYQGQTANACQTGTNNNYPGLCKLAESYPN